MLDEPCEIKLVVSLGAATFRLDDYTGQDYEKVRDLLMGSEYGLKVTINMENNDSVPSGIIIRQLPTAGAEMKTGDAITLYVSEGVSEDLVKVPNLVGLDESAARVSIERNGLKIGNVIEYASDSKKGLVVNQSIVVDTMVERNTEIDIFVSTGKTQESETPHSNSNSSSGNNSSSGGNQSVSNENQNNDNNSQSNANQSDNNSAATPQTSDNGL
jgi:serine/threonine-protein kinase